MAGRSCTICPASLAACTLPCTRPLRNTACKHEQTRSVDISLDRTVYCLPHDTMACCNLACAWRCFGGTTRHQRASQLILVPAKRPQLWVSRNRQTSTAAKKESRRLQSAAQPGVEDGGLDADRRNKLSAATFGKSRKYDSAVKDRLITLLRDLIHGQGMTAKGAALQVGRRLPVLQAAAPEAASYGASARASLLPSDPSILPYSSEYIVRV